VIAGAITIPILLLLYFLKLRRRPMRLSSTLLWEKSFEDLQVNVPFQRLRPSLLLFLQSLMLLALLLAAADPVIGGEAREAERIVLLIDRSASMNAADASPIDEDGAPGELTRLEVAKAAARRMVERSRGAGRRPRMMVIAFGSTPEVMTGFESRPEFLFQSIDRIETTDEPADLEAALSLAGSFAMQRETEDEAPPDVVLISDGTVLPPTRGTSHRLRAGNFRYQAVGPTPDEDRRGGGGGATSNVGIVSIDARREFADPTNVVVFARLLNASEESVSTLVTLLIDGQPGPVQRIEIPGRRPTPSPASAGPAGEDDAPNEAAGRPTLEPAGEAVISFNLELPRGALIQLRHGFDDPLPADDTAAVILPQPARPRIALVHPSGGGPDPYVLELLQQADAESIRTLSRPAYMGRAEDALGIERDFDLVVFDRVSPERLPGVPSLTFGAVPPGVGRIEPESEGGRRVLSWMRQHPIMRHVSLDRVVYRSAPAYQLPPGATALARGPEGPIIALLRANNVRHVAVSFALQDSNWPLDISVAVFLQNVLDEMLLATMGQSALVHQPGEPLTVRLSTEAEAAVVRGPGTELRVPGEPGDLATLPPFRRVGLYEVEGVLPPHERIAVSLLSDVESDTRPRLAVRVNAEEEAGTTGQGEAPRHLWPWLLGAALVLLMCEWLIYCRKVHV
jgi:hypothetical protein